MQETSHGGPDSVPVQRARLIRQKVSQKVIDELNQRHERILASAADVARQVIELGEMLLRVKNRLGHGKWLPFVENNLCYSMRTVQRYMRAYENRYDIISGGDPAAFMARIWGNDPKQVESKNDVDVAFYEDDEEEDEQSGGSSFAPGFEREQERGKPGMNNFKLFISQLNHDFLENAAYTDEAKIEFLTELITWLQGKKEKLENARGDMSSV